MKNNYVEIGCIISTPKITFLDSKALYEGIIEQNWDWGISSIYAAFENLRKNWCIEILFVPIFTCSEGKIVIYVEIGLIWQDIDYTSQCIKEYVIVRYSAWLKHDKTEGNIHQKLRRWFRMKFLEVNT